MRLLGKVAVITGAASGIGKEIARAYRRERAKVVIADLDQAGADAAATELGGKDAVGLAMDVTSEAEVEAGMAKAVSFFGRVDVLVSNAGMRLMDYDAMRELEGRLLTAAALERNMGRRGLPGGALRL
jgi:3-hydroxybutyrate dehydrogenase